MRCINDRCTPSGEDKTAGEKGKIEKRIEERKRVKKVKESEKECHQENGKLKYEIRILKNRTEE